MKTFDFISRSRSLSVMLICFFFLTSTLSLTGCGGGGGSSSTSSSSGGSSPDISGITAAFSNRQQINEYLSSVGMLLGDTSSGFGVELTDAGYDFIIAANKHNYKIKLVTAWDAMKRSTDVSKSAQDVSDAINTAYASGSADPVVKILHPSSQQLTPDTLIGGVHVIMMASALVLALDKQNATKSGQVIQKTERVSLAMHLLLSLRAQRLPVWEITVSR